MVEWKRIRGSPVEDFQTLDGDEIVGRDTTPWLARGRSRSDKSLAHTSKIGAPVPAIDRHAGP
jgi:hypothetical protein